MRKKLKIRFWGTGEETYLCQRWVQVLQDNGNKGDKKHSVDGNKKDGGMSTKRTDGVSTSKKPRRSE
jgi:hypothetical protein